MGGKRLTAVGGVGEGIIRRRRRLRGMCDAGMGVMSNPPEFWEESRRSSGELPENDEWSKMQRTEEAIHVYVTQLSGLVQQLGGGISTVRVPVGR